MMNNSEIQLMKKTILIILMSLVFIIPADAQALKWNGVKFCCIDTNNSYVKLLSGFNFLQNTSINGNTASYETGYIIAGSWGYCWRYGLILEAEYAFRHNGINEINLVGQGSSSNGHYQASSYMANLLWNVPLCSLGCKLGNPKPFIGAGIGYDHHQIRTSNSLVVFQQYWDHFAWQLMAGLVFPFYCNTELTMEYKFHQGNTHFYNHTFGIGIVYSFGCKK